MKNEHPTSVEELNELTKPELVEKAEELGLTVERTDGKTGEPRVEDYVEAISKSFTANPGHPPELVNNGGRFTSADGKHVTVEGEPADSKGNPLEA